ncbi:MAG: HEAT repeat domain-containing protein, partial [Planctomycetota bacterium]
MAWRNSFSRKGFRYFTTKGDAMRTAMILGLALILTGGIVLGQAPPDPPPGKEGNGEEKPKSEGDQRWDKIVEILNKLVAAEEATFEERDKVWKAVEEALFALGPKALPQLHVLVSKLDPEGRPQFPGALRKILGKENWDAEGLVRRVMWRHRWVSPKKKAKRVKLLTILRDEESLPADVFADFSELGWYGVEGLEKEFAKAKEKKKLRMKILEVLQLMSSQGVLDPMPFLLDLILEKANPEVQNKAFTALVILARDVDKEDVKKLHKQFQGEKAYPMFVGFLRLDPDADIRVKAAAVLGYMEVKEAVQVLNKAAFEDEKEKVQGEAVEALRYIGGLPDFDDWSAKVKAVKAWVASNLSKMPKQLSPAPPVRVRNPDRPRGEATWDPAAWTPKTDGGQEAGGPKVVLPEEGDPEIVDKAIWGKVVEILPKLNTEKGTPPEAVDAAWQAVEKALFALGPGAIPQLRALLPKEDEKGIQQFSKTVRAIRGYADYEV